MAQIAPALAAPVLHPVELLDWATGGPRPQALDLLARDAAQIEAAPVARG
jgi:glycolate oxidase iron-sulfur subunit